MLNIVTYPDPLLRKTSQNVANIAGQETSGLIKEMKETMIKADGAGLAAPQIGQNINIVVINFPAGAAALINPRVLWKNWFKSNMIDEGCLSFPKIFGLVKRPRIIIVKYRNEQGQLKLVKFSGLLATVVQHEIDHLRGILFIDRIIKFSSGEKYLHELEQKNQP